MNSAHDCYALLWLCLGFRLYIKLLKIIIEKKKNHQKIGNKWLQNRDGGHDVWEAVFMLQGSMFTYPT